MKATERRPSPEELLRRVQEDERRESRGRLKVFLGYASRVGKSYRMFDEGRRRHERGQDVVVGAVQRSVPPEIQAILDRLEVVPTVAERHAGREYRVIDMAALFRRHPSLVLIDGLANDNPPGSRNPQRWQDVEELLDRGISVITAVNVQHIREQQDEVERITGKRAADSIPLDFLREADEIEVVDAPPEALLERGDRPRGGDPPAGRTARAGAAAGRRRGGNAVAGIPGRARRGHQPLGRAGAHPGVPHAAQQRGGHAAQRPAQRCASTARCWPPTWSRATWGRRIASGWTPTSRWRANWGRRSIA